MHFDVNRGGIERGYSHRHRSRGLGPWDELYKVNPGKRSNIVDSAASVRSARFYDRDEVENLIEGRVHPTITSSSLSPFSLAFTFSVLRATSTARAIVFSTRTLAPGAVQDDYGLIF